ncbi:MAG: PKD domain-containing protein, partial [Bacteroidales bacterium]
TNQSDAKNGEPLNSMSFLWDFDNGNTSTQQDPTEVFTNTGVTDSTYQVELYVETQHGCRDTTSQDIVVHPDPVADFNPSVTADCAPFTIDDGIINLVQYGNANHIYEWTIFDENYVVITTFTGTSFNPYTMAVDSDTIYVQLIAKNSYDCNPDTMEVMFITHEDPIADFSMDIQTACHPLQVNFTNTSTPTNINYYWNFGDGATSTLKNPVHTFSNTSHVNDSVYTIQLIASSGQGCTDTIEKQVTVLALPEADFGYIPACEGKITHFNDSSVAGTASITLYEWDFGNGNNSYTQNPTNIYDSSGTFTTTLKVTNGNGCVDSISKPVTVHPLPNVSYTHDSVVCVNTPLSIINTTTLSSVSLWDFGNATQSTATNPQVTYTSPGYYQIKLISTTSNGCVDSLSSTVHVIEAPNADFVSIPDTGCAPLSVLFQNQSTGYQTTYYWNFGNGQTSNYQHPLPVTYSQGNSDTTYYPDLTAVNQCGTDTHSDSILVRPQPVAGMYPNKHQGCSPLTISFSDNLTYGNPDTLIWIFADTIPPLVTTQSTFNSPVQYTFYTDSTISQYTVAYIAKNECGSDTVTTDITVYPNEVNAFFNADTLRGCPPFTVNFTNSSLGYTDVSWDFGDGTFSNQISPAHTYTQPGFYNVELAVTDSCGYDTANILIRVDSIPVVDFVKSKDTVCANEPIMFTNTSPNALSSLSWDFGDNNTSNQNNPYHSYDSSGTYNVTLTGYSTTFPNYCPNTITKSVVVLPTPKSVITADTTAGCPPLTVNFQGDSSFNTWYFGNGNSSVQNIVSQTYYNSGNYTVTLISEYLNGCADTSTFGITVHPEPTASFYQSVDSTCVAPSDVLFTNASTGGAGNTWIFGNGSTSTQNDSIWRTFDSTGIYQNYLIVENQYGCVDSTMREFIIYDEPKAQASFKPDSGCRPLSVQFTNSSVNSNHYLWDFGDGNTSTTINPVHQYLTDGQYQVSLIAYGNAACADTSVVKDSVIVYPSPDADFDFTHLHTPVQNSGQVQFNNLTIGGDYFWWDFGDGGSDTAMNPLYRYEMYGDYIVNLLVENIYGCQDTVSKPIKISEFHGLYVSNAFSPEMGPDEVRSFKPKGVGLAEYHIYIYDTWGNLIWESTELVDGEPAEGWDGTDKNGDPMPQDTYVWKIDAIFLDGTMWPGKTYDDGKTKKYGTVTLIR